VTGDGLVEFLRARLDEDEQWALAASAPYPYADPPAEVPAGGLHWEWVAGDDWTPVAVDPATEEFVGGGDCGSVWLASREQWPSRNAGGRLIRQTTGGRIEEMRSGPAGHIARHDPARVLAEVEAKREVVDACAGQAENGATSGGILGGQVLRLLAEAYSDHPDYRQWTP
jgi:Family of unknown function (DUF6221)